MIQNLKQEAFIHVTLITIMKLFLHEYSKDPVIRNRYLLACIMLWYSQSLLPGQRQAIYASGGET